LVAAELLLGRGRGRRPTGRSAATGAINREMH
jgi:hypothetical protein